MEDEAGFNELVDQNFITSLSDGSFVELIPNGEQVKVTFYERKEYARLAL